MDKLQIFRSNPFLKFIFFGAVITFFSNIFLMLILLIFPLGISTFLTQILHAYLGYLSNKYSVFKRKGKPKAYIILVIFSWILQWILIKAVIELGFSSNMAVLIVIPLLATFSFTTQKLIIFK